MSKRKNKKSNSFVSIVLVLIIFIGIIILISNAYMIDKKDSQINQNKEKIKETKKHDGTSKADNTSSSTNTKNIMDTNDAVSEPAKTEKDENKQENANNITVKIELIGEEEVIISKGEKYNDLGAKAIDSNGKDISNRIKVDNSVDTNKEGTYTVTYSIGNSIVMRYVIVK